MEQISSYMWLVIQGLLLVALPIVIAAAVQHYRAMTHQLRQKLGEDRYNSLISAAQTAVRAAEQAGITQGLLGPEKRKMAIDTAESFLASRGFNIDLDQIAAAVEAEVHTQFTNPSAPKDSPEARHALLQSAIDTAIRAAEQSGLKGTIQNVAAEKSAYAVQMAMQALNQRGVNVDPGLVAGIVRAQLAGAAPPSATASDASTQAPLDGPAG